MIDLGDPVPDLALEVRNPAGVLENGGAVVLTITLPDGTSVTPAVSNTGAGLYSALYFAAQYGQHAVRWVVTGINASVYTDEFNVESPPTGIVSLALVKEHLGITRANHDEVLRRLILSASDLCESPEGTGRTWRRTVVTAEPHNGGGTRIPLNKRPVLSVISISIDGAAGTISDYDVETWRISSINGAQIGLAGRRANVLVTYVAGGQAVPSAVRDGVLELVRHLYAIHRGGSNLPRQDEPDFTESAGYLLPNRVTSAWRAYQIGL